MQVEEGDEDCPAVSLQRWDVFGQALNGDLQTCTELLQQNTEHTPAVRAAETPAHGSLCKLHYSTCSAGFCIQNE